MGRTFSQIYIQVVFAVKGRQNLIAKSWKDDLNKYISGIITNKGQKSIIVNGMHDHIHAFIGLKTFYGYFRLGKRYKKQLI